MSCIAASYYGKLHENRFIKYLNIVYCFSLHKSKVCM